MLPALGPEHDHPAHHQRQGDGDRIEQPLVDQVGEQDAEDYRREERDQQVGGETLGLALARQVTDDLKDLSTKLPDDSEDRRQLDDDVERLGAFAAEADEVGDDDLVPGAGNRQELGQPWKAVHHSMFLPLLLLSRTSFRCSRRYTCRLL